MTRLDERFESAVAELDGLIGTPALRPMDEFRRRDRRRTRATVSATVGLAIVAVAGLAIVRTVRDDDPTPIVDSTSTSVPAPEPPRVPIGTDLFAVGHGWLDGRNFQDQSVGPFMVYETEFGTEPSYWYYKGRGIVPIGTKYDSQAGGEQSTTESSDG